MKSAWIAVNPAKIGLAWAALLLAVPAGAAGLGEHVLDWPTFKELWRVLTLKDYNTRVVIIGTTLLGLAAGLSGTFLLLRKRALLSDTLSHATLPGIALAFILMTAIWGDGKHLLGLIAGAAVFSILGTISVMVIRRYTRLKDDAALGIVLSVYFGLGIALLGLATRMEAGNAAGLSSFIYGKTASMLMFDAVLIAAAALGAAVFCLLFFKEFTLICFDADYASTQGWPVGWLDLMMMALVVVVTVIGLQAVGLILVVALLIIPPAAARFWTHNLRGMLLLSGLFGAISGLMGSGVSALMANLPAGAVIVLAASMVFVLSMTFGTARGIIRIGLERRFLVRKIQRENLLREIFEWAESLPNHEGKDIQSMLLETGPRIEDLLPRRAWPAARLQRALGEAISARLIRPLNRRYVLTESGLAAARQIVRKHRLWEAYLLAFADIAPGQVDWGADEIEHVLDQEIISKLESMLKETARTIPRSPHQLLPARGGD